MDNKELDNAIIESTARDYDLPFHIVESIYNKYKSDFYERLEEELKTNKER